MVAIAKKFCHVCHEHNSKVNEIDENEKGVNYLRLRDEATKKVLDAIEAYLNETTDRAERDGPNSIAAAESLHIVETVHCMQDICIICDYTRPSVREEWDRVRDESYKKYTIDWDNTTI